MSKNNFPVKGLAIGVTVGSGVLVAAGEFWVEQADKRTINEKNSNLWIRIYSLVF
jgi:hypothetical protein